MYGMKLSIWRVDNPGVTLEIDLPEVGEKAFTDNPALEALRSNFEGFTGDIGMTPDTEVGVDG